MASQRLPFNARCLWICLGAFLIWCLLFPEDLDLLFVPIEKLLSLTQAVSPACYGLLAVGAFSWAWYASRMRSTN